MPYDFDYSAELGAEGANILLAFAGVLLVIGLLAVAFGIACYVLESLGMYTIAKRRGIHNPWLAWIPVGNVWILGSISDQYQYVVKGRVRNRRKVLLGLCIGSVVLAVISIPAYVGMAVSEVLGNGTLSTGLGAVFVVNQLLTAVGIVAAVFQYIAYYDLYMSCNPENAVLYLVLSILFSVAMPFFIFFSRKKDLGMPPRKPQPTAAPQQIPQTPVWQKPVEPVLPPVEPFAPPAAEDETQN